MSEPMSDERRAEMLKAVSDYAKAHGPAIPKPDWPMLLADALTEIDRLRQNVSVCPMCRVMRRETCDACDDDEDGIDGCETCAGSGSVWVLEARLPGGTQ